jgi:hypothetical protein
MIMPGKHIPLRDSLLAAGGVLLADLRRPTTPSALWDRVQGHPSFGSFGAMVLALDFLFAIGAVALDEDGMLVRSPR